MNGLPVVKPGNVPDTKTNQPWDVSGVSDAKNILLTFVRDHGQQRIDLRLVDQQVLSRQNLLQEGGEQHLFVRAPGREERASDVSKCTERRKGRQLDSPRVELDAISDGFSSSWAVGAIQDSN